MVGRAYFSFLYEPQPVTLVMQPNPRFYDKYSRLI